MVTHTMHCGDRQTGHRSKANLGYTVSQAYTHDLECWSIAQRVSRQAPALQSPASLCSSSRSPYPGWQPLLLCREMCPCVTLSRTLLQGSLGHQVFRLLSHLCWGDRERKVWLMKPCTAVPIGTTRQSVSMCRPAPRTLRHNFCGTIRRWAKPSTVRRKHTNGLLLAMYPARMCR